ncbi:TonB-dependent receptor [Flavilitoribacter nigricans]|uniref:TonB-dependent receptor plug domain-containing protein n=1 Tax=Flavilitoribacter nigricans (strain ATCC 23147 / DSM 23189 / NBRC 102662 / NCIMB 1420 / SS-2) TaxID=1122177 RepID=A0A2D0MYU2_FLAN2|nr:TonB-dependent receptor [Flavilitoribacter nigricans]PHN01286.1 hypothetical protein CRP01_38050 [Flavilitoribacter nigricans DSM 23189 = NBRC 102662]
MKPLLSVICWLIPLVLYAQASYTISGYVEDAESGEKLIAANVYDEKSGQGVVTNTYGFFSLTLPADSITLTVSYIGYSSRTIPVQLTANRELIVALSPSVSLEVVEVSSDRFEKIEESSQMSRIEVPVEQIKRIPALLGEVDILKTLQLLPGVQSGGEGQTGLYVRGGSPDQNLILLDGVPIYNASHLLGIFSVFNADAIRNVTLTKGGFPARYGGRLSSVLEINMKEGNLQEFHGEGSIGLITSKLTLEAPIVKGKTSFLISGRRTYADLIFSPIIKATAAEDQEVSLRLFFYDLNAKVQHKINNKHRLFASTYLGSDVFSNDIEDELNRITGGIDWGNLVSSLRWNYQITPKLFANTTLTYSNYEIDILAGYEYLDDEEPERFAAKYFSGIEDVGTRVDLDYIPSPRHYIRMGASATAHRYRPGALSFKADFADEFNLDTLIGSKTAYSTEYSAYVEDDLQLGALKANIGLHASAFKVDRQWYSSIQPRLSLRYLLHDHLSLKASFSTMTQYINLLTSESFSLPTDLWVPSTARIRPQQAWQAALGAARTLQDKFEVSVEAYYKKMSNVLSYKEGASFLFGYDSDWQDKVTQGQGEAYGLEFFFQKKKGRTTGWLGYTLSWNHRQFDDINSGQSYPFRYDRRHDISLVVNHDLSDKVKFSAAWVYGTGNAISLNTFRYPRQANKFTFDGRTSVWFREIEAGTGKNAFRMTDYHRLDLSVAFHKQKRHWERTWTIGLYNAYYHRNPYFVVVTEDSGSDPLSELERRKFQEISILPIIPSVSYGFKF